MSLVNYADVQSWKLPNMKDLKNATWFFKYMTYEEMLAAIGKVSE